MKEISCTKGGRLAIHQVNSSWQIMFHIYVLDCHWCSNSGVVVTHTLFFDLGVAVTEINTKKSIETRNKKH